MWTGSIVLNCSKMHGKVVNLVSYSLLHSFQWLWAKAGVTRRGFFRAHNNRMMDQYGVNESDLMTWSLFNEAVNMYSDKVLEIN